MRALVTGGAGFIGSSLAERLCADEHEVVVADCFTPYYDHRQKAANWDCLRKLGRCRLVEVDLRTADLAPLLADMDVVFHQAGQPGVRSSWEDGFSEYLEQNVLVTQRLLEAARRAKVRRIVYASSSSVYGNAPAFPTSEDDLPRPQSPYGVTKLAGEHLCGVYARNWGLDVVALRYFTVYGPRQRPDMAMHRLIEAALSGNPFPMYGEGQQIRDYTFVGDVVDANLKAATTRLPSAAVMNVSGGSATTLTDVIATIEELTERPIPRYIRAPAPGDVHRTGGSSERAAALLGWQPTVDLREGLARQIEWHQQRAGNRHAAPIEVVRSGSI